MKNKNAAVTPQQYRQGDVLIERIDSLPGAAVLMLREKGRVILAHGEVTNHAHAITAAGCHLHSAPGETATFLQVQAALVALSHDEHSTIDLPRGTYRVTRQREYSPEAIRNVAD